jgi:hypothetical protein
MIDFNNIKCALKGSDATYNIVNIFFRYILKGVPKDTWIAPMQLMNTLWVMDVKQWSERILEFMDWPDWILVKTRSHHIFPLGDHSNDIRHFAL